MKFYDVVDSIQIESRLQDIEIAKNDGKIILAQAKASKKPLGSNPNEKSKLSDAILSLIKSDREKVDKLIYVSNLVDPLLSNEKHEFDSKIVNYEYLSEDAKNSITNSYEFNKYLEYEKLTRILADYYDYRRKTSKDYIAFINDKYMSYCSIYNSCNFATWRTSILL